MNDNIRGCVVIKVLRHSLFSDLYGRAVLFFRRNVYCVFAFVDRDSEKCCRIYRPETGEVLS